MSVWYFTSVCCILSLRLMIGDLHDAFTSATCIRNGLPKATPCRCTLDALKARLADMDRNTDGADITPAGARVTRVRRDRSFSSALSADVVPPLFLDTVPGLLARSESCPFRAHETVSRFTRC